MSTVGKIGLDIELQGDQLKELEKLSIQSAKVLGNAFEESFKRIQTSLDKLTKHSETVSKQIGKNVEKSLSNVKVDTNKTEKNIKSSFKNIFAKMKLQKAQTEPTVATDTPKVETVAISDVDIGEELDIERLSILNQELEFARTNLESLKEQRISVDAQWKELEQYNREIDYLREQKKELEAKKETKLFSKEDAEDLKAINRDLEKMTAVSDETAKNLKKLSASLTDEKILKASKSINMKLREIETLSKKLNKEPKLPKTSRSTKSERNFGGLGKSIKSSKAFERSTKQTSKGLLNMKGFTRSLARNFLGLSLILRGVTRMISGLASGLWGMLSTNTEFSSSLKQIKSNLYTAFVPIYNAILPAINALAKGIAYVTGWIATLFSMLGGKSVQATNAQAKSLNNATKQMKGYSDATEEAQGQLAGFDQVNDITPQDSKGGKGGGDKGMDVIPVDNADVHTAHIKSLLDSLKSHMDVFSQWTKDKFGAIWDNFKEGAFQNLEKTKEVVSKTWGNLQQLGSPIQNWFDNHYIPLAQTTLDTVGRIFNGTWDSMLQYADDTANKLFIPLAEGLFTNFFPVLTDFYNEVINSVGVVFDELKATLDLLWEDAVVSSFEIVTKVFNDFFAVLKQFWDEHGKPIFDEINLFIKQLGEWVRQVWQQWISPVLKEFKDKILETWDKHVKPTLQKLLDFLGEVGRGFMKFLNEFVMPVVKYFTEKFAPLIQFVLRTVLDCFDKVIRSIASIIDGLLKVIRGIIDFLVGVFTGDWEKAWNGVVGIFTGIWDTIKSVVKNAWDFILGLFSNGGKIFGGIVGAIGNVFKSIINFILKGINRIIATPFDTINGFLNMIKDINIMGITPFKGFWGYNPLPVPQIPLLAKGGVLTEPRLVMAGEYAGARSNPEIVTPQNIMFDTMMKALDLKGNSHGSGVKLVVNLGNQTLFEQFLEWKEEREKQFGYEVNV